MTNQNASRVRNQQGSQSAQRSANQMTNEKVSRILTEDIVTLAEARDELHRVTGRRPDKATIWRWMKRGVGGIRLDAIRLGREILTSKQAITRFIAERSV